jgi:hypothetical protein
MISITTYPCLFSLSQKKWDMQADNFDQKTTGQIDLLPVAMINV